MDLHEKLRIIGKAFSWEKVTQGQARSAAPHITTAADRLEVLEIEHAEFFERWHATMAEAGEHDCDSNRWGAVSVRATNGQMLGVRPAEFEPLEWRKNEGHNDK